MVIPKSSIKKPGMVFYLRFSENGARKRISLQTDSPEVAMELRRQFDFARARGQRAIVPTETPSAGAVAAYGAHRGLTIWSFVWTPGSVKLLLPPRHSPGASLLRLVFGSDRLNGTQYSCLVLRKD